MKKGISLLTAAIMLSGMLWVQAAEQKFECESLLVATSSGISQISFDFPHNSGKKAIKLESVAVGDYIEFTVNVPEAGAYDIKVGTNTHNSRGKFKLLLPETNTYVGAEYDQYGVEVGKEDPARVKSYDMGTATLSAGKVKFRFEVTGKNVESVGYTLAFDYITLSSGTGTPAPQQSTQAGGTVEERIKNATVLKLGSSDAIVNNKKVKVDSANPQVAPVVKDDRTLVPVRFISESLNGTVGWDQPTQTVTVDLNGSQVKFVIGNKEYTVDGAKKTLDVAPEIINDRTMLPLRAMVESVGQTLFWDDRGLIVISGSEILNKDADAEIITKIIALFN